MGFLQMTKEDFLQIFKSGFHKLNLEKVKLLGKYDNGNGRTYYKYYGLFKFEPPYQVFDDEEIDYQFLKGLLKEFSLETSNCITRKFTKKVIKNGKTVDKLTFKYVFDIVPKNVVSFKFNKEDKTMTLIVKGYGIYQ